MRKWLSSFWENYKYRFVPWIVLNLKQKEKLSSAKPTTTDPVTQRKMAREEESAKVTSAHMIVHHVTKEEDKLLTDEALVNLLLNLFEQLLELEKGYMQRFSRNGQNDAQVAREMSVRSKELMHNVLGYSVERRKSQVAEDAGTGVFLVSGQAKPGSLIALYPGTVYMPSEPLFFPSLGNPFIFRCSDNFHIDGNDKWISKSIYKSCAARDKFRVDLPCCDESWLTPMPLVPINVGQYVNNRSKSQENNVVYHECQLVFGPESTPASRGNKPTCFPVHLCKYLPNVWSNPDNNHHPLRVVPLVAVKQINEGDEILSSYFTVVHESSQGKKMTS